MRVPAEPPQAWVDPKASASGLGKVLDTLAQAPLERQAEVLSALVKLLVRRGVLDEHEVLALLGKP